MTTTCADIVTRSLALSVANQGLLDVNQTADVQDALNRINQLQTKAFTRFTAKNKTAFLSTITLTSTAGNGGRVLDLSARSPRVQRIVKVTLASGVEVALVDPNVQTAEMAPRYFTMGESLAEVSNDWDPTTATAVPLTLLYTSHPVELDVSPTAALTQAVSVPDRYSAILTYGLGAYLAQKDVGRSDAEVADLQTKSDDALDAWINSAAQFGGTPVYSFEVPSPTPQNKD